MVENTGALSIIRVTDRVGVAGFTVEMAPTAIQVTLAIVLKSGFLRSQAKIIVRAITPSQRLLPNIEFPALFEGDERGVQLIIPMGFVVQESGLYWFEVLIEDQILTRIPLRVLYQQVAGQPGLTPGMPPGMLPQS
jgi:uncharacterized protein DUF6941